MTKRTFAGRGVARRLLVVLLPALSGCTTPLIDLPALSRQIAVPANYCPYGTVRRFDQCQTIQPVEVKRR
jgi:hypothetical protein